MYNLMEPLNGWRKPQDLHCSPTLVSHQSLRIDPTGYQPLRNSQGDSILKNGPNIDIFGNIDSQTDVVTVHFMPWSYMKQRAISI